MYRLTLAIPGPRGRGGFDEVKTGGGFGFSDDLF